ncbi:MAG: PCRF domain-containing protein, partial [Mariprofundaceae bacterium]
MNRRLDDILHRRQELTEMLADPETTSHVSKYREISREFAEISPVADEAANFKHIEQQIADNKELLTDPDCDPELKELAEAELPELKEALDESSEKLRVLLLPKDPNDSRNAILEVRAGTGGDEAALFAADLFRMYSRYAEHMGFKIEVLSSNGTDIGGYKEIIAQISGKGVFSRFKFESGVHRVQRVPSTETQGRIHTSACTVAILPEAEEVDIN